MRLKSTEVMKEEKYLRRIQADKTSQPGHEV